MDTRRFADVLCKTMTSWFITWKPRSASSLSYISMSPLLHLLLSSASRPTVSPGFGPLSPQSSPLYQSLFQGPGAPDSDEQGASSEALSCEEVIGCYNTPCWCSWSPLVASPQDSSHQPSHSDNLARWPLPASWATSISWTAGNFQNIRQSSFAESIHSSICKYLLSTCCLQDI